MLHFQRPPYVSGKTIGQRNRRWLLLATGVGVAIVLLAHLGGIGASRLAPALVPAVSAAQVPQLKLNGALGDLGVDTSLLDSLKDNTPLTSVDREPFYSVLAAAGQIEPGRLLHQARDEARTNHQATTPVLPLFQEPARHRGQLVSLSGTACRVVRLAVEDREMAARFHFDHYYEIELFTADSQNNPITVCVPEIPQNLPTGGPPACREPIEVAGFFFKVWQYPTPARGDEDRGNGKTLALQSAPLLIGSAPVWRRSVQTGDSMTGLAAGGLIAIVMVGIWMLVWHLRQNDREFHDQVIAKGRISL